MDTFFTKKELAKRWKCSESAINSMIADGKLKPSRKVPGIKFPASQILRIEEAEPVEISKVKIKQLATEITRLTEENNELKKTLRKIWSPLMEYMKEVKI